MNVTTSSRSPISTSTTPNSVHSNSTVPAPTQPIPKKSQQIKTDKPRPHICTICTRAFARLEHLKRHERSHTNEKPFQCAACGRCFARRDLVLRHQQKLHASLPNIMRRGSSKDFDTNEHIIILHNNTNANAPLPSNNVFGGNNGQIISNMNNASPGQPQLYSPPKSNEFNLNVRTPQFRTSLFNHSSNYSVNQSQSPNNVIPSPMPTTSSQNTSPTGQNANISQPSQTQSGLDSTQQPSPQTGSNDSPKKSLLPKHLSSHLQAVSNTNSPLSNQYRHASFSASSAISYTNLRDALSIQQNNTLSEAPIQVDFATPQLQATELKGSKNPLSGIDLVTLGIDWNNIDMLDLNNPPSAQNDQQSPTSNINQGSPQNYSNSNGKQKSLRNVQSYFDSNVTAPHQFHNPNHPHHIKGTTHFEFGVDSPKDIPLMENMFNTDQFKGTNFELELNRNFVENKSKRNAHSQSHSNLSKKFKIDEAISESGEWLKEIINTPYESNFPTASHNIGFIDLPGTNDSSPNTESDDISSLFRSRQIDLVKQMNPILISTASQKSTSKNNELDIFAMNNNGTSNYFMTEELRKRIILISNLSNLQFPPLEDLNHYMKLYELEFNKYFPFIHLPSLRNPMVDNFENIPLLLSMAAIGALYSYHDSNSLLLFNLSKFHIHNFFEKEITLDNLQFKKVPLMAHQCLVLHIFISFFLNDPNMIETTSRQIKSMVGLVKSTNFNKPLDQLLIPPPSIIYENDPVIIQNNFDYFIMAQSRIRTIYVFHMLQVFRNSLLGLPILLPSDDIGCGNHCLNDNLWRCEDSHKWFYELSTKPDQLNKSIIELSNAESLSNLVADLDNHYSETNLSYNNLLTLLVYIHEQIQVEILKFDFKNFNFIKWRLEPRPKLENMIRSWESFYIKNGGFLVVNDHNHHLLNSNNELKIILPLYSLAKIRLSINLTPIMEKVLHKDWDGMNIELNSLSTDLDALKESINYSLDVINLWTHNISVVNDINKPSLRTPVFFVTCLFMSILIISNYLKLIENSSDSISVVEKVCWLNCEKLLLKVENILSSINESNSYSETLRKQANGAFDSVNNKTNIKELIDSNVSDGQLIQSMKEIKLSTKSLYLGVGILADAPVWPLTMGLAEALKIRATYISIIK